MDKIILSGGSPRKEIKIQTGKTIRIKREREDPDVSEEAPFIWILNFFAGVAFIYEYSYSNGLTQNIPLVAITFIILCVLSFVTYRLWQYDFYYYETAEI